MDWGSPLTLGINGFNIIISLTMIAVVYWLFKINYPRIAEILNEKLSASLNRSSADESRQPLYDVFYGFNHAKTEQWVDWIKTQSNKKQLKAFSRLAEYLQEPPRELGLISKEVVKAVIHFNNQESYDILHELAIKTREKWGQYKSLSSFYEDAIMGLVNINPEAATDFLLAEINNAHSILDSDSLKKSIVTSFSGLEDIDKLSYVLKNVVIDSRNSISIKSYAFKVLKEKDEEKNFELIIDVLKIMINKEEKDHQIFDYCFASLLNAFTNKDTPELRSMIKTLIKNKFWGTNAVKLLADSLSSASFELDSEFIFDLLHEVEAKDLHIIKKALSQRYKLSDEEKTILNDVDDISRIDEETILPKEIISLNKHSIDYQIPESLQDDLEKLRATVETKFPKAGIKLLLGDSEAHKYYLLNSILAKTSKALVYVDVKQIILSPVKLDELESIINSSKPCVVYLADISTALKSLINEPDRRVQKLTNTLKKYFNDSRVSLFASIPKESIEIRTNDPEIFEFIKVENNEYFSELISVGETTPRQKQKIFNNYEMKIEEQREVELESFEEILKSTEDFSKIKYLNFVLNYMQNSLLTSGHLMSMANYKTAIQRIAKKDAEIVESL